MIVTVKTHLAGVVGWPVAHSLSPRLHGFWLARHGIDGLYLPLALAPSDLVGALRLFARLGFAGVNVTIPHKEAALEAVDEASALARRIGAVNMVTMRPDGHLKGENSDAYGFVESLRAAGFSPAQGPVVVIGAGGAARAVVVALLDQGAPEIRLLNRTAARAQALARDLDGSIATLPWGERHGALEGASLLVNTTSLGMVDEEPLDLSLERLTPDTLVTDLVYRPLETSLLKAARARGARTLDGLGMLLHQARPGFAAWFGVEPEVDEELRAFVLDDEDG